MITFTSQYVNISCELTLVLEGCMNPRMIEVGKTSAETQEDIAAKFLFLNGSK